MSQYTPISLDQMRAALRPESGWIEIAPSDLVKENCKEHVFEWPIPGVGAPVKVYTSVDIKTGWTRSVGDDAIRVCVPGWRKSDRVYRVEGWREKLVARVTEAVADVRERFAKKNPPAPVGAPATPKPTYMGVLGMFAKAKASGLKKPAITFQVDGVDVQLKVCGPTSKYRDQIAVTDGGPFGASVWFGAINQQGVWSKSQKVTPAVEAIVDGFNADPAGFGAKYGKKTGRCCFCHRHLETDESVFAGYGPVCADKWGLPWGEVEAKVSA